MNWEEFVEATHETAFYPDAGKKGNALELAYVALGIIGEVGEYLNCRHESVARAREKLGDSFWYLARAYYALDGFETDSDKRTCNLAVLSGLLANTTKKVLRDGMSRGNLLKLKGVYSDFEHTLSERCANQKEDIFDEVIAKLRYRKERGALVGSGDKR